MASRTEETEQFYMREALRLCRTYQQEKGMDWDDDPMMFCRWLGDRRSIWMASTWRTMKASTVLLLERSGDKEAVDFLKGLNCDPCKKKSTKSSSRKAKHLSIQDLAKILEVIGKSRSEFDVLVGLWLLAGRVVGLRPTEWMKATLNGDTLKVKNSKNTNGRSHGEYRQILIHNMSEENKQYIVAFLAELDSHLKRRRPSEVYFHSRRHLHRVVRKIWPNRTTYPTLYSARHQFSADLKKADYELTEIAALFGHATDRTATEHYGKRQYGEGGGRQVEADPEEVSRIRKTYRGRPDLDANLVE